MDYSNPAEWEAGKLLPNTLDIESAWLGGYNSTVGVSDEDSEEDWSIPPQQYTIEEEAEVRENDEEREAISELSGGTGSHEPYFTDERGSKAYKTTC